MFGAIYGDIIGSYYETHCTKNYDFPLMRESCFTDDSVLTAAVCRAVLDFPEEITFFGVKKRSRVYGAYYRQYYGYYPYAGFGQMFSAWAKDYKAKCGRSYANGAAMRVIPIGYFYNSIEQIKLQVKASCLPTHNNREAINYATAVACSVFLARQKKSKAEIRAYIEKNHFALPGALAEIKPYYVFDSRSSYSVPPAILAFLESANYEDAVRLAVSLGGDADTQACIAGGLAEAFYGEIPPHIKRFCDARLEKTIKSPVAELMEKIK